MTGLPPPPKAVLFDLDGTLVDSVPDLAASVDQMLRDLGLEPCGVEAVRRWVGNGVEKLVARALAATAPKAHWRSLRRRALARFHDHYRVNNGRSSTAYPGTTDCLRALRAMGVKTGCVTNKPASFTRPLLELLGLRELLAVVVSGDDLPRRKPDPAPLLLAASELAVSVNETLFVGDSSNDVLAAKAAGMAIWCVPYGYNHGIPIEQAGPDRVIATLDQLPAQWRPRRTDTTSYG